MPSLALANDMKLIQYVKDFVSLLYPPLCASCERPLYEHETYVCSYCLFHLPITNFHVDEANAAAKQLWGRVHLKRVSSYLYFVPETGVQRLLHQLKYASRPELGTWLGAQYGHMLKDTAFSRADVIIPVPLHPKKHKQRGYNQSEYFGKGLSETLHIPLEVDNLIRHSLTASQTTKSRFERFENMQTIFEVRNPSSLHDKHILLVDDVLTTGATIEACAHKLLEIPHVRVSVVTLAYTK